MASDYSEFKTGPGDNLMAQIAETAREQLAAEKALAEAEELVVQRKDELRRISEGTLQQLMDEADMTEVTTKDGIKVKVGEEVRASISKRDPDKAMRALQWLSENGYDKIIKRQFTIQFGRDDEAWADKFERDCKQRKKQLNMKREKTVAPATVKKLVKELLDEGIEFPQKDFGVFRQRVSKIQVKE